MKNDLMLNVAVSPALLAHLWAESRLMKVPIQWLVAGLICDTFDSTLGHMALEPVQSGRAVA